MINDVTFERTHIPRRAAAVRGRHRQHRRRGRPRRGDRLHRAHRASTTSSRYEHDLITYATKLLREIPGLTIIGTAPEKAGVISFILKGIASEEVGARLNKYGIAVRSGHHCAQPILRRFGLEATVRPSFAFYNTCGEIDALAAAITDIQSETGLTRL